MTGNWVVVVVVGDMTATLIVLKVGCVVVFLATAYLTENGTVSSTQVFGCLLACDCSTGPTEHEVPFSLSSNFSCLLSSARMLSKPSPGASSLEELRTRLRLSNFLSWLPGSKCSLDLDFVLRNDRPRNPPKWCCGWRRP